MSGFAALRLAVKKRDNEKNKMLFSIDNDLVSGGYGVIMGEKSAPLRGKR